MEIDITEEDIRIVALLVNNLSKNRRYPEFWW